MVFPQPDSPTMPRVLPSSNVNDTSSTACNHLVVFPKKFDATGKYFLRFNPDTLKIEVLNH